jgi:hypothetical protein
LILGSEKQADADPEGAICEKIFKIKWNLENIFEIAHEINAE